MRILFVKDSLSWPPLSGHDLHTFNMMKAMAKLNQEISLFTIKELSEAAINSLSFIKNHSILAACSGGTERSLKLTRLQERFRSYWGIEKAVALAINRKADEMKVDVIVGAGLEGLSLLGGIQGPLRIWYAADEWIWHHFSQLRLNETSTWWSDLKEALIKGVYERVHASVADRVWVVSKTEQRAMQWLAGMSEVDIVPNGVDSDFYTPTNTSEIPKSIVFWGCLDFGPNIQALSWFCSHVWPAIIQKASNARFTIIGSRPCDQIRKLSQQSGIYLLPDLPDLRSEVSRHAIVVLPFVSGGGIKNKLLEAACLGKPIICSPKACGGVKQLDQAAIILARNPETWISEAFKLWDNKDLRHRLGATNRRWALRNHTWESTAQRALAGIEQSLRSE
jgi:polysaccharide biosynthesis protein PslH